MKPTSIRFIGVGSPPRTAPFALAWADDGEAIAIQLASDESTDAIPEATTLAPGTCVFVLPEPD